MAPVCRYAGEPAGPVREGSVVGTEEDGDRQGGGDAVQSPGHRHPRPSGAVTVVPRSTTSAVRERWWARAAPQPPFPNDDSVMESPNSTKLGRISGFLALPVIVVGAVTADEAR